MMVMQGGGGGNEVCVVEFVLVKCDEEEMNEE